MSRRYCEGPINWRGPTHKTKRILVPACFMVLYVPYAAFTFVVAYELFFTRFVMICVFAAISCFQMEFTILPKSLASFDAAYVSQIQLACMSNRVQNPVIVSFFQQWLFDTRERRKLCSEEQVQKNIGRLRIANRLWLCLLLSKHPTLRGARKASCRVPAKNAPPVEPNTEVHSLDQPSMRLNTTTNHFEGSIQDGADLLTLNSHTWHRPPLTGTRLPALSQDLHGVR